MRHTYKNNNSFLYTKKQINKNDIRIEKMGYEMDYVSSR